MSNILTIGYTTEGVTDERFLRAILLKTFEEIALSCNSSIEVFDPVFIRFSKKRSFVNDSIDVATKAFEIGINVLCIHIDADANTDKDVRKNKIEPLLTEINKKSENNVCKNLVSVIPVYMTESWMLVDKELFKSEIGTTKSDADLGINKNPEIIANPKKVIEDALIFAQNHLPSRRNKVSISDLYQPIGQKISISKLQLLDSFSAFKCSAEEALRKLNYLN